MKTHADDAYRLHSSVAADYNSTVVWCKWKLVNIHFHNCNDGLPFFNANASWAY